MASTTGTMAKMDGSVELTSKQQTSHYACQLERDQHAGRAANQRKPQPLTAHKPQHVCTSGAQRDSDAHFGYPPRHCIVHDAVNADR